MCKILRSVSGVQEHFVPLLYESEWHMSVTKFLLFIVLQKSRPNHYSTKE